MTLTALIVDDERLARGELRRLLAEHRDIEIIGEAANAMAARTAIVELDPDIVFLDVQMPGESGFDLLQSLDSVPAVVFTTAYDEYALRAFDVSAVDYLVKPIDPYRLARAVARVLAAAASASHREAKEPSPRSDENEATPAHRLLSAHDRVFMSDGDRFWLVQLGDVRLFESVGNYTRAFFGAEKPLINRSLGDLEQKLDNRVFFRANRHQIVNVNALHSIHAWFGGRLLAKLDGGHEVTISRRRARVFRDRMSM